MNPSRRLLIDFCFRNQYIAQMEDVLRAGVNEKEEGDMDADEGCWKEARDGL